MVRMAKSVISRERRNELSILLKNWKSSYTLDQIHLPGSNYFYPLIYHSINVFFYLLFILAFKYIFKNIDFSFAQIIAIFSIPLYSLLFIWIFSQFFKEHFTSAEYFTICIFSCNYCWPLLYLISVIQSCFPFYSWVFRVIGIFSFSMLNQFFLNCQFDRDLFQSQKSALLYSISTVVSSYIVGLLYLSVCSEIFLFG